MSYRSGFPRYVQIADILRGELKGEGERIPSEHQLCAQFKVSRPTIRQALDMLVQEGLLYRHAGRGTFSTPASSGGRNLRIIGSLDDMIAQGDETWFKLASLEGAPLPANIAQALRRPPGSSAYRLTGVRHADTGPFQYISAYLPEEVGRALSDEDLSNRSALIGAIERQLGVRVKVVEQGVEAVLAPRQVAELLQVKPRTPLLLFERTYFAATGEPVEYATTYQAPHRYPYRIVLSRAERRN